MRHPQLVLALHERRRLLVVTKSVSQKMTHVCHERRLPTREKQVDDPSGREAAACLSVLEWSTQRSESSNPRNPPRTAIAYTDRK